MSNLDSTGDQRAQLDAARLDRATLDKDILATARQWCDAGREVALCTVVNTWGSSPRPAGSQLLVDQDGEFIGSVSGGCIEGAVIREALQVMQSKQPSLLEFGVSDSEAWEVGLACGGKVQVFVEPLVD